MRTSPSANVTKLYHDVPETVLFDFGIYNLGMMRTEIEVGTIKPHHTGEQPSGIKNRQLISILSLVSLILERNTLNVFTPRLDKLNDESLNQFDFCSPK